MISHAEVGLGRSEARLKGGRGGTATLQKNLVHIAPG